MPGPLPASRPFFPADFLEQVRQTCRRRTAPADQRQRGHLALLLDERPELSNVEAGQLVGLHPDSVRLWRRAGRRECTPCATSPDGDASLLFPPLDRATVTAVACETVYDTGRPLSRQSLADVTARVQTALGKPISKSTVWRTLDADLIKPWQYEHWIFPRDPDFAHKAGIVLDLYAGLWQGERLDMEDCILSSDEKTSIQARLRRHKTLGPGPDRPRRVEHEYGRGGALAYFAAWDVQLGQVNGRCEATTGIEPFHRLVDQVMAEEPYRSASRVFWVVDNGSSHRGEASRRRLTGWHANAILVHLPVHASWLNQVEIYFSLVQRKVLTPNDFTCLQEVEVRLRLYELLTNRNPRPFNWTFDRRKLEDFLRRLKAKQQVRGQAEHGEAPSPEGTPTGAIP